MLTALESPDENGICKSTSSITLHKYTQHLSVALCIKVVYAAKLPTKPAPIPMEYTVGWDIFMPTFTNGEVTPQQRIDFFCQQGPGMSAMKDLLWSDADMGKNDVGLS